MKDYQYLSKLSKVPLSTADHNLNNNIIIGLDDCMEESISLINNVPIPNYPKFPRIFFSSQLWHHTKNSNDINCGFINLPVLKHLSRFSSTYKALKKTLSSLSPNEKIVVMTYDLHPGICSAINRIKKKYPFIISCIILPDVPTAVLLASSGGNIKFRNRMIAKIKMLFYTQFDSYVFLTKYMKDLIEIKNKKYAILEGIYNTHQPPLEFKETTKKIILYSGQLNPAYGMENLLISFQEIYRENSNYELWICGSGALVAKIEALSARCPGIKYFGYLPPDKVRKLQESATILVNPRQNTSDFTKFSFPSKTMEYLASGRPVVCYKLDGIPDEYDQYLVYVNNNSTKELKQKLMETCELPTFKRKEMGKKAQEFIYKNKNPQSMATRIINIFM